MESGKAAHRDAEHRPSWYSCEGREACSLQYQHRQNLLSSLSKSLAKIIFPRNSILCLFLNSPGRAEASAVSRWKVPAQVGSHLSPRQCWVKHCQPAALLHLGIPTTLPPAAVPAIKFFTLHLNSFFMSLGWDHCEKRYLNLLPKTSACHFSPSLPTSVLSCLALPLPFLAPAGTWILVYFYSSSGWKPKVLGMEMPQTV